MTLVVTALAFLFASQKERTFWMPMLSLLLAGGLATLFPNPVIKGQKVIPVSYTHLDVYKRQPLA